MHFALATFFGRPFRDHPLVLLAEPPPVRAIRLSSSWSCSFSSFVGLAARSGPLFLLWSVGLCALLCVAVGCSASPRAPVAPTFASRPVRALRAVWIDAPVLALRFRPGVHVRALRSWRHLLLFALFACGDLLFPLLALFLLPVSRSSLLTTSALVRALRFSRLQFSCSWLCPCSPFRCRLPRCSSFGWGCSKDCVRLVLSLKSTEFWQMAIDC